MYIWVLADVLLAHGSFCQDSNGNTQLKCITGYSVNGRGNFTTETCTSHQASCQSKMVRNGPIIVIYKICKEGYACENNKKNNDEICYGPISKVNSVQVCHFCCNTDFCNTMDEIPDFEGST